MFGRKRIEALEMELNEKNNEINRLKKLLVADEDMRKLRSSNIYGPGKYIEGINIAPGIYDLRIDKGSGYITAKKERIYLGKSGYNPKEYYGFMVEIGKCFEITGDAYVSFIYRESIVEFKKRLKNAQEEATKEKDAHWEKVLDNEESAIVCSGSYKGGVDIPVGVYDVKYVDGEGYLELSRGNICEKMSKESTRIYRNLRITQGCKMSISDTLKVEIYISQPILPKECNETTSILYAGTYKGGVDIPEGRYLLKLKSGKGFIEYGPDMDECAYMGENDKECSKQFYMNLKKGAKFSIYDDLEIEIYNAPTIVPLTESVLSENVIIPGEYIVGEDIEEGKYYLKRLRGYGSIEVIDNTDNRNYEYMSFEQDSQDENDRIKYIRLYNSDKLIIDGSLEIEVFRK